jgi:hypothetical protein
VGLVETRLRVRPLRLGEQPGRRVGHAGQHARTALGVDLPGHGTEPTLVARMTLEAYIGHLTDVLDTL